MCHDGLIQDLTVSRTVSPSLRVSGGAVRGADDPFNFGFRAKSAESRARGRKSEILNGRLAQVRSRPSSLPERLGRLSFKEAREEGSGSAVGMSVRARGCVATTDVWRRTTRARAKHAVSRRSSPAAEPRAPPAASRHHRRSAERTAARDERDCWRVWPYGMLAIDLM